MNFTKIDGRVQRKTQRGMCFRAHGKRAEPIGYKLSCGERKEIGTVAGIKVEFATGFGTAPPATDSSEAGPRGEEGFYRHFGTGTPSTGTSVASQCSERPADRSMTGN